MLLRKYRQKFIHKNIVAGVDRGCCKMNYFAAPPWEKPFASPMGLAFCIFSDAKPRFFSRSLYKYTFCSNPLFIFVQFAAKRYKALASIFKKCYDKLE